ncbi:uncharacterized protein METZ01_LOCUS89677, partial [marine metagenome]
TAPINVTAGQLGQSTKLMSYIST